MSTYQAELPVDYNAEFLRNEEWASTPEDILERHAKHGLHLIPGQKQALSDWMFTMAKSA